MFDSRQLGQCITDRWSPTIGDPTVTGWSVVAAYAVAAAAALAVAILRARDGRERVFWTLASLAMVVLAVNKQLDLQSAVTATGRCLALEQGWYDARRAVQTVFVGGLAALSALACLAGLVTMRGHLARSGAAVVGLCTVVGYVLIRAVGFHHVDALISTHIVQGVDANPLLELIGIVLVALNAGVLLVAVRPPRERPGTRARP